MHAWVMTVVAFFVQMFGGTGWMHEPPQPVKVIGVVVPGAAAAVLAEAAAIVEAAAVVIEAEAVIEALVAA